MRVLVAICLLIATVYGFPKWHQLEKYTFEHYVRQARRPYVKGTQQWKEREAIFNARLEDIKQHNADGTKSWKRGINQFSDWTQDEWRDYNRAQPPTHHSAKVKVDHFQATRDPTSLPRFVDYRLNTNPPVLTGVKNQGSCGSCWSHAATQEVESFFALRYGQLPVLSQQQIVACTTVAQGCGGGTYAMGWDYIAENGGLNEEWTYPYTNFFAPEFSKAVTHACRNITAEFPNVTADGKTFTFTWWPKANISGYTVVTPNDAHAMMEALATVGPQAIAVGSDPWSDYESGILQNNYSTAATNYSWQSINHAVQMVGYGFDFDLNMNYWIVRNSWGTNYGEQGYIRLARPEHEVCGNVTGTYVCGTSGVLAYPMYPHVTTLEPENGFYF